MKDRIPKYAGRVKLTPVANQPNIYDMERADEPLETGTPLNKATLLDDETAVSLGLTEDSNVTDALKTLSLNKVNKSDIIDNLVTSEAEKPLSANQGVVLNGLVNNAQGAITDINNKFDNGILKTENGGTGANNFYDALDNAGVGKTYIGQYEGTGTTTLELVLPYKPKAILMMGGGDTPTAHKTVFAVIELSNTHSIDKATPVVYYSSNNTIGTIEHNFVSFNKGNNTLTISKPSDPTLAFNKTSKTHTYIMFS